MKTGVIDTDENVLGEKKTSLKLRNKGGKSKQVKAHEKCGKIQSKRESKSGNVESYLDSEPREEARKRFEGKGNSEVSTHWRERQK